LELDKFAMKPIFDKHPELMETMALAVSQHQIANQQWAETASKEDIAARLHEFAKRLLVKMKSVFG